METIEYLRIARRRWWVIVLGGLLAVVAVVVTTPSGTNRTVSGARAESFVATEVLVVQPGVQPLEPNLKKVAFLTTVGDVPRRAATELAYDGAPAVLAAKIAVTIEAEVGAVRISATDTDGARAVLLARTFAKHLVLSLEDTERARQDQARKEAFSQIDSINAAIADIDRRGPNPDASQRTAKDVYQRQLVTATERAQQLAFPTPPHAGLVTLEQAVPIPTAAASGGFSAPKSRSGRILVVGLFGVFVAAGLALALDRLDPRVQSREAAETAFGLPVLAEVPELRSSQRRRIQVLAALDPGSTVAQAYRMLRTSVLLRPLPEAGRGRAIALVNGAETHDDNVPKVVLMVSADPGEGTTTAVANLAASFAESGRSVLVVACDLANPTINLYLGAGGGPGVTDVLASRDGTLRLRDVVQTTSVPGVTLVPAGTPHLRMSMALAEGLLAESRLLADIVLIDTGSLFGSSEAGELLGLADSVLLVARIGRTNTESAVRAGELLTRFGAPTAGIVLLGARGGQGGVARRPRPRPDIDETAPAGPDLAGDDSPDHREDPASGPPVVADVKPGRGARPEGRPAARRRAPSDPSPPTEPSSPLPGS